MVGWTSMANPGDAGDGWHGSKLQELSEREILALAVSLEEEDGRIYADFADGLREDYPATAKLFEDMREEESGHRAA